MASALSAPHFHNEEAAYAFVEKRIWPNGPVCPHCGGVERISKMQGKSTRIGTYKCYQCRKPFTVKIGTIFEASHVPMHLWLQAMYLIAGSKKGTSSNQLHRILGVTLKTAWFMSHRIREAMTTGGPLLGGDGGMVEVDETYIGRREGVEMGRGGGRHKMQVLALVDRNSGEARSFSIKVANLKTIALTLEANVSPNAHLMTDQWRPHRSLGWNFADHSTVNHRRLEYVSRDNPLIHTNTVEGFFSVFKRGMKDVYQHCREKRLQRYVQEFSFRHTNRITNGINDAERAEILLVGVVGKRLTYQTARIGG
jgi:transposase-like protein